MQTLTTVFPEVQIFAPDVFPDARGFFKEVFSEERYAGAGIRERFLQDNVSFSRQGVVRGLHYAPGMGKLVQCLHGAIFDVFVDVRDGSPTFHRWGSVELTGDNHRQVYIPAGFAHGFLARTDALVLYKQTAAFDPARERGVRWNDPAIGIEWPLTNAQVLLSSKDASL